MGCACKDKNKTITADTIDAQVSEITDRPDYSKLPTEHCAMCAEKHFATAFALMQEAGYHESNQQSTIDELICAIWHLAEISRPIAVQIRDIKHAVLRGETVEEAVWVKVASELYTVVNDAFNLQESPKDVITLYKMIGELVCCGWHIYEIDDDDTLQLAADVRNIRHKLQQREIPTEQEWIDLCIRLKRRLDKESVVKNNE